MQLNKVLKLEDLSKIYEAISEEGYGDCGLEIVISVRSKEILEKVNEEFYYNGNNEGTPPDVNEVNVQMGGIRFKYVVVEESAD